MRWRNPRLLEPAIKRGPRRWTGDPAPATGFANLDSPVNLERSIAEKGIYTAVDPLASSSPSREDTIRSFEELCSGKWDHLPEQSFMYVGKIEEAAEKAEKQAVVA
jgi:F0F1-type ATP synthase beta subunit